MKTLTASLAPAPAWNLRARAFKTSAMTLGMIVLLTAVFHFSGDALLTWFLRPKLEEAFSAHLPGSSLRLGALHYGVWRNRLTCDAVAITRPDGAGTSTGLILATGVNWRGLMMGNANPAQILRDAQLEVTDLSSVLPKGEYRLHCGNLRISVPNSEIVAQALSLQLVGNEEAYFASTPFRRPRYRLAVAACSLRGVGFADLFGGKGYRAQSVELTGPVFDSLVPRDKPRRPVTESPPMPHEALAAMTQPFRINRLTITDGMIKYASRRFEGAEPGVLTFSAVQISANEIANVAAGGETIALLAEGRLMDAGKMTLQMHIPVAPSSLAFRYSGELSAMDLTRLDEFMEGAGRIQIKSGSADGASFDIDVVGGHARGTLRGVYRDLQVKVVDRDTGSDKGVTNRVATLLANQVKVRRENTLDKGSAVKTGKVDYVWKPEESFLQFAWLALRTGVMDLIQ